MQSFYICQFLHLWHKILNASPNMHFAINSHFFSIWKRWQNIYMWWANPIKYLVFIIRGVTDRWVRIPCTVNKRPHLSPIEIRIAMKIELQYTLKTRQANTTTATTITTINSAIGSNKNWKHLLSNRYSNKQIERTWYPSNI